MSPCYFPDFQMTHDNYDNSVTGSLCVHTDGNGGGNRVSSILPVTNFRRTLGDSFCLQCSACSHKDPPRGLWLDLPFLLPDRLNTRPRAQIAEAGVPDFSAPHPQRTLQSNLRRHTTKKPKINRNKMPDLLKPPSVDCWTSFKTLINYLPNVVLKSFVDW